MDIQQSLHERFGFHQFLPGQREVISRLLDGSSTLAIFPTGQGKSLCYQLTALHLPGLTLVVSPLMALMKDQVDFLQQKELNAARLDSSLSHEEYQAVQAELTAGSLKLLYVAPERFANERFLAALRRLNISMMVIDEAHCISEWGHNFRPDYLKLAGLAKSLAIPVSLCLTATATPKVAEDICAAFAVKAGNCIQTGFYRPNLTLRFTPSDRPLDRLIQRLTERQHGASIVYVTLQATAEQVADQLRRQGLPARPYHAGLKDGERQAVQEWFMPAERAIVVATIAFGMGIDKADIRSVYHYNLPKSLENYCQEIGRAGRDGKEAVCEVLGNSSDLTVLENFSYGDTPGDEAIQELAVMILDQPEKFDISVYQLSHAFDIRPLVVTTLLTYLELEGVIASTGPFYTSYKFLPHTSSAEMFAGFDAERVRFLQAMFSSARKGRKWFRLDLKEVMEQCSASRERIVAALTYLEERGHLDLKASGVRQGYKKTRPLSNEARTALIVSLQKRFRLKEQQNLARLSLVVDLVGRRECQTNVLLQYFGQQLETACGHCEYCLTGNRDGKKVLPADDRTLQIPAPALPLLTRTLAEQHPALTSVRQQSRFFCGLSSPRTSRAGLLKHPAFGLLSGQPFDQVRAYLQTWSRP